MIRYVARRVIAAVVIAAFFTLLARYGVAFADHCAVGEIHDVDGLCVPETTPEPSPSPSPSCDPYAALIADEDGGCTLRVTPRATDYRVAMGAMVAVIVPLVALSVATLRR